jgi:hypothetical protein
VRQASVRALNPPGFPLLFFLMFGWTARGYGERERWDGVAEKGKREGGQRVEGERRRDSGEPGTPIISSPPLPPEPRGEDASTWRWTGIWGSRAGYEPMIRPHLREISRPPVPRAVLGQMARDSPGPDGRPQDGGLRFYEEKSPTRAVRGGFGRSSATSAKQDFGRLPPLISRGGAEPRLAFLGFQARGNFKLSWPSSVERQVLFRKPRGKRLGGNHGYYDLG